MNNNGNNGEILIYQSEDGQTRIDVQFQDETAWLTQGQMADLFQTTKQNISLHVKNVFEEGELDRDSVVKESLTTADAEQHNMGLTSWPGGKMTRADVEVAKNYLNQEEIDVLNRLVSMYLDFAELQAINRKPIYMQDWITKLDDFLHLSEREILSQAGKITHKQAVDKAHAEYDRYRARIASEPSPVEKHFIEAIQAATQLEKSHKTETK